MPVAIVDFGVSPGRRLEPIFPRAEEARVQFPHHLTTEKPPSIGWLPGAGLGRQLTFWGNPWTGGAAAACLRVDPYEWQDLSFG